jgi:hypothetical protein
VGQLVTTAKVVAGMRGVGEDWKRRARDGVSAIPPEFQERRSQGGDAD